MKKLMYIPLVMLTTAAYGVKDQSMSPEDQTELRTVMQALATCMGVKKELDPRSRDSHNHRVESMDSVPDHFKIRKEPSSSYFIPSTILNESCELVAQRYTELVTRTYRKPAMGGLK
jgi:hypothetical protein